MLCRDKFFVGTRVRSCIVWLVMSPYRGWCGVHVDPELRPRCRDCVFVKKLVQNCDDHFLCPAMSDLRRVELHREEYGKIVHIVTLHLHVDSLYEDRGLPEAAAASYGPGDGAYEYHVRGLSAKERPSEPIVNMQPYGGNKMFLELRRSPRSRFVPRPSAIPWPRPSYPELDMLDMTPSPEVVVLDATPSPEAVVLDASASASSSPEVIVLASFSSPLRPWIWPERDALSPSLPLPSSMALLTDSDGAPRRRGQSMSQKKESKNEEEEA